MLFTSSLAVLGLATLAKSHMTMNTPVPFGKSTLNNSPLDASGSDFPCKQRAGVYDAEGADNQMALGSVQPLSFTGSAVHGGGSCQISITYDKAPTVNSVWKVIHSIEGGCPMRDIAGNNGDDASAISPSKYTFTVPDDIPTGVAVLAWSWFNKVGNREMYMNCAPITITGGASKRSDENELMARNATQLVERDTAAYNALPDMLVANINSCQIPSNMNVVFANPGNSVEKNGLDDTNVFSETCGGAAAPTGGSGSAPTSAAQATTTPTASSSAAKSGLPGGVFVTVPASSDSQPAPTAAPAAPATSAPAQAPSAAPAPSQPEPPAGTGTTGSGSALSGSCTSEGEWNCIGGSSFQRCASGSWSAVQQLAAGTTCKSGASAAIDISAISKEKRAIRFSHEHIRRHLRSS